MTTTMLVTGGHGFLGRRVRRLAEAARFTVVAPASAELDIRDAAAVGAAIGSLRPDVVVHLAYRRTEQDTIVDGSANVARWSAEVGARLVHLSTDVVFGGRETPYREADRPHPVEAYGQAKSAAEVAVTREAPDAVLVRTSLLLADDADDPDLGRPELDAIEAATGRSAFGFFTDEIRCPARAVDVAAGVLRLATTHRDRSGPLHLTGPEAIDRASLARRIVTARGLDPARLVATTTVEAGLAGRRPGRVELDVSLAAGLGLACRTV